MTHSIRPRQGFTLVELLVVITVIAILASMVVPAIGFVRELANKAKCANNLKGISTALLAYQNGSNGMWPDARYKLGGGGSSGSGSGGGSSSSASVPISAGAVAAQYTAGVFEILCANDRGNIPATLFRCPSQTSPSYGPDTSAMPQLNTNNTNWGWNATGNKIPYGMDWSAPTDSGSVRVILADRDPANHKDKEVVTCFADSHTSTLKRVKNSGTGGGGAGWATSSGGTATEGLSGSVTAVVYNDDAKGDESGDETNTLPDNIFDDDNDYNKTASSSGSSSPAQRCLTPGGGSSRRSCIR